MTDAEYVDLEKSTIVRTQDQMRWRRLLWPGGRILSAVAPGLAAQLAERLLLSPPRAPRPAAEIALLASARARPVRVGRRRIETWTWGRGPRVLLVHGWGGRGAELGAFVAPLVQRGFSVVSFDAPGHGASDRGPATLVEMTAAIHEVGGAREPIAGLVAHSVGAVAATRALHEGLEVAAAVYVAPAADLVGPAVRFGQALGLSRDVRERMQQRIEARAGQPWSAFQVTRLAPTLETPLLVIHDRGDAEVPWQHGVAISQAWPGAELLITDGLGHHRILRAPDVVAAAVAFVAARTAQHWQTPQLDRDFVESLPALAH
jgi:pimeloyl-ACP methyl ester carboxylesterase